MTTEERIDHLIDEGYTDDFILDALLVEEDGTVTSGDFGNALPADSRHNWKDDGEELNKESRKRLRKWGIKLKFAGKNQEYLKEKLSIIINKKAFKIQ